MTFHSTPEESLVWFGIFKESIDSAFDSILITDAVLDEPGPHIVHANPAFCR